MVAFPAPFPGANRAAVRRFPCGLRASRRPPLWSGSSRRVAARFAVVAVVSVGAIVLLILEVLVVGFWRPGPVATGPAAGKRPYA